MMTKDYAVVGPPFDFQGHMTLSQKTAFYTWLDSNKGNFTDISLWWQIRSQQLRKTAGALEAWYSNVYDTPLKPRFDKATWEPSDKGHFFYKYRDDLLPSVTVGRIKEQYQEQLARDDEGMFQMNHIRTLIEKAEDRAQYAFDAPKYVATLRTDLDRYFGQPEFEAVLVNDKSDTYKGSPRYRTHQLNAPTPWEIDNANVDQSA
jgi:hypothetical protein